MRDILITAVVAVLAVASPAMAQPQCAPAQAVAAKLLQGYGERPAVELYSARGHVIVVYANAETHTWTVVIHRPDGQACVDDDGEGYAILPEPAGSDT